MNRWLAVKDVLLTGLGMFAIWSQIRSLHPNGLVLGAGLALTVPTIASHVRALLPGPGDGPPSSSPPGPSPPGSARSSTEASDGDHRNQV